MDSLLAWKRSPGRKPLILNGARQVGKTWLLKRFGEDHFDQLLYFNCEGNDVLKAVFEVDFSIERIVRSLLGLSGATAIDPERTLIVFDEVQEAPRVLTSLKYFCEDAPEYFVACAGSLLGIALHEGASFPVGKVQTLGIYPLTFEEFLGATPEAGLLPLLQACDWSTIDGLKLKYADLLRQYLYVGGMPEAVQAYLDEGYVAARTVQRRLLDDYERDFSKHLSERETEKVRLAWQSAASQMARENDSNRFIFSRIAPGARARDYETAIQWLIDAGMLLKVNRVTKAAMPLRFYEDVSSFKLYLLDVGLYGSLLNVGVEAVLEGSRIFSEGKGALTEQYVCQQLAAVLDSPPCYWSARGAAQAEVDFLAQVDEEIMPIEVKAEESLRAKSLRLLCERTGLHGYRFSMSSYREQDWMTNLPLYAVEPFLRQRRA